MAKKKGQLPSPAVAEGRANLLGSKPAPDTEGKTWLDQQKAMDDTETLMLKGILSPSAISRQVGISRETATHMMERVEYRWAHIGDSRALANRRGASRARLNLITKELWEVYRTTKNDKIKVAALKNLLAAHDRFMLLDNLTDTNLKLIDGTGTQSIAARMARQQELSALAGALSTFLQNRGGKEEEPVDAEFTEVESTQTEQNDD